MSGSPPRRSFRTARRQVGARPLASSASRGGSVPSHRPARASAARRSGGGESRVTPVASSRRATRFRTFGLRAPCDAAGRARGRVHPDPWRAQVAAGSTTYRSGPCRARVDCSTARAEAARPASSLSRQTVTVSIRAGGAARTSVSSLTSLRARRRFRSRGRGADGRPSDLPRRRSPSRSGCSVEHV